MSRIAIAILAAGQGKRMGGDIKQLVRWGNETLLSHAIQIAHRSSVGEIFVVLGYQFDTLLDSIEKTFSADSPTSKSHFSILRNDDWSEGIASSIRTAVRAANGYDAILFMTIDQPFVDEHWLQRLRDSFIQSSKDVVASCYGLPPSPGIPALFASSKFDALSALQGDRGAKQLINESDSLLLNTTLVAYDIDTQNDLQTCLTFERAKLSQP